MGVMPQLAKYPPFTNVQAARLRRDWLAAGRRRTSLLIAPALIDVVGRKFNIWVDDRQIMADGKFLIEQELEFHLHSTTGRKGAAGERRQDIRLPALLVGSG